LARKESRGLHFTLDYPESSDQFQTATVLDPRQLKQNPAKLASL
jgi:aspartate oxidase